MSSSRFTSTLLRTSATGFAGMAASRLAEALGENGRLVGGFDAWQAELQGLVLELSAALEADRPEHFAERVRWTRDALVARDLPPELFLAGLKHLQAQLEESLPPPAREAIPEYFEAARRSLERPAESEASLAPSIEALVTEYVAALRQGDADRAKRLLLEPIEAGSLSVEVALEEILFGALREIGRLWHLNDATVAEEHFVSVTTGDLLSRIVLAAPKKPSNGKTVVLAMVEGDSHDLGIRTVAALFEIDGWRTVCLGHDVPAVDLLRFCERIDADLVVLGATLNTHREAVARTVRTLRTAGRRIPVLLGGAAFREAGFAASLGADTSAQRAADAVRMGRRLAGLV